MTKFDLDTLKSLCKSMFDHWRKAAKTNTNIQETLTLQNWHEKDLPTLPQEKNMWENDIFVSPIPTITLATFLKIRALHIIGNLLPKE